MWCDRGLACGGLVLTVCVCCVLTDAPRLHFGAYNPLVVLDGEPVVLTCHVDAYQEVPANNVQWYKSGVYLGKQLFCRLSDW